MASDDRRVHALREAWEEAIGKDRPRDALAALEGLELLEPDEARWAHRKGEVLRRLGRAREAEAAFVRAVDRYAAQGFLTRAAALAKVVIELNPARADILVELDRAPAQKLREARPQARATSPLNPRMPPPARLPSGAMPAMRLPEAMPPSRPAPIPRDEPVAPPKAVGMPAPPLRPFAAAPLAKPPVVAEARPEIALEATPEAASFREGAEDAENEDEEGNRPTLVAGVRAERLSIVAAAMGLEAAKDADDNEVRFDDVPDVFALDVDVSELVAEAPRDSSPEIETSGFPAEEAPTAVRLALMSAATLFVDVPKDAMAELVAAAQLIDLPHGSVVYRSGERADALYVVVEGGADVVPLGANKKLAVTEGSVFGEDALLQGAVRNADARVKGQLLALRIPKDALDGIVRRHASLADVLFNVLMRRLVTTVLQTSPLFAAFDLPTRKELARLFEVRRATAGVVIKERGKRSDGLYIPLAGELEADDGKSTTSISLGTMFGHTSLVSDAPELRTIRTLTESVVLRMAAARFVSFAARFPAALAHLAELAKGPQAL